MTRRRQGSVDAAVHLQHDWIVVGEGMRDAALPLKLCHSKLAKDNRQTSNVLVATPIFICFQPESLISNWKDEVIIAIMFYSECGYRKAFQFDLNESLLGF